MDLRSGDRLSDDVVMKVRSEEPLPYRGVAFDVYNGKGWETSFEEEDLEILSSDDPRFDLFSSDSMEPVQGMMREVSQVFYVEQEAANVIFGAYRPETVFFPMSSISVGPAQAPSAPRTRSPKAPPTRSPHKFRRAPRINSTPPAQPTRRK